LGSFLKIRFILHSLFLFSLSFSYHLSFLSVFRKAETLTTWHVRNICAMVRGLRPSEKCREALSYLTVPEFYVCIVSISQVQPSPAWSSSFYVSLTIVSPCLFCAIFAQSWFPLYFSFRYAFYRLRLHPYKHSVSYSVSWDSSDSKLKIILKEKVDAQILLDNLSTKKVYLLGVFYIIVIITLWASVRK